MPPSRVAAVAIVSFLSLAAPAREAAAQGQAGVHGRRDFALEALGGSAGSLVGIGLVALASECGVEDMGCIITTVGAGGVMGAAGATLGVTLAARATGSPRSFAGAAIGAVVGTGVGLGLHWLLNHNSDRNLGDRIVVPIFVLSQGVLAAAGSRIGGR